jgi:hypothetical protein
MINPQTLDDFYANSFICRPYGGVRLTKRACLARRKLAKRGRQFNSMKGMSVGGEVSHCRGCKVGEELERGEG